MISDFQQQKLSHLFHLLDVNKNGHLQLGDFMSIAETLRNKMGLPERSSRYQKLCDSCKELFEFFRAEIALPKKRTIALSEWIAHFEQLIHSNNQQLLEDYKNLVYGFLFDVFDENHDGYLSESEYRNMFEIYNLDTSYLKEAFKSVDVFADNRLSKYELINAIEVYLNSDNEADRGNLIFGSIY